MEPADTLAVTALAVSGACLLAVAVLVLWTVRMRAELATLRSRMAADQIGTTDVDATAPAAADPAVTDTTLATGDAAAPSPTTYLITGVGDLDGAAGPVPAAGRIDGRLFADLVLRESVVKAASLAHGVRRAVAPEARYRIRAEMRREVRRARRQRRADLRAARRHLHTAQRRAADEDAA